MIGRIRPARPADAAAVANVHVRGWRETYPGIVPDRFLAGLDESSRERYWRLVLENPSNRSDIYIAELSIDGADRVVGFGVCGPEQVGLADYTGEFHALYVLRAGQGRGLGTGLMTAMAGALAVRGMTAATVWVLRDNRRARRFYETLGGRPVADRPLDFGGTEVMEVAYGWPDVTQILRGGGPSWC
jgi:ribosomal protein S18 acetylase RimI-like enzyme